MSIEKYCFEIYILKNVDIVGLEYDDNKFIWFDFLEVFKKLNIIKNMPYELKFYK